MNLAQQIAQILLDTQSVKINVNQPFTYTSGIKSPIYCDNRALLGYVAEREAIVTAFVSTINPDDFDVVVGIATAGIPWASLIASVIKKPLAYVRSKPKEYGTGKQIEGASIDEKRILLIEDLISTGKSSVAAIQVLQASNCISIELRAIFSYEMQSAVDNFKAVSTSFSTLSTFSVLMNLLATQHKIDTDTLSLALEWNKNPAIWGR